MKELVEKYRVGICANTDGSDYRAIVEAMNQAMQQYDSIKDNMTKHGDKLLWDSQNSMIQKIVDSYLK